MSIAEAASGLWWLAALLSAAAGFQLALMAPLNYSILPWHRVLRPRYFDGWLGLLGFLFGVAAWTTVAFTLGGAIYVLTRWRVADDQALAIVAAPLVYVVIALQARSLSRSDTLILSTATVPKLWKVGVGNAVLLLTAWTPLLIRDLHTFLRRAEGGLICAMAECVYERFQPPRTIILWYQGFSEHGFVPKATAERLKQLMDRRDPCRYRHDHDLAMLILTALIPELGDREVAVQLSRVRPEEHRRDRAQRSKFNPPINAQCKFSVAPPADTEIIDANEDGSGAGLRCLVSPDMGTYNEEISLVVNGVEVRGRLAYVEWRLREAETWRRFGLKVSDAKEAEKLVLALPSVGTVSPPGRPPFASASAGV